MNGKVVPREELKKICEVARKTNQHIVFTNGCLDILHVGHVRYLKQSKALGDILVVGINSDSSVRSIKGTRRPLVNEADRAEIVSSLYFVDYVSLFPEPDPLKLIQIVRPHTLVKGADWPEDQIAGAAEVKAAGGRIERIVFEHQVSTTRVIQKIQQQDAVDTSGE